MGNNFLLLLTPAGKIERKWHHLEIPNPKQITIPPHTTKLMERMKLSEFIRWCNYAFPRKVSELKDNSYLQVVWVIHDLEDGRFKERYTSNVFVVDHPGTED